MAVRRSTPGRGAQVPRPVSPRNRGRVGKWDTGAEANVGQRCRTFTSSFRGPSRPFCIPICYGGDRMSRLANEFHDVQLVRVVTA